MSYKRSSDSRPDVPGIGYDLVDLSLTDPSRTERLAAKFMNAAEWPAPGFLTFHQYCWLCWSVKEAVYKYSCRTQPGLVFSPAKIVVTGLTASLEATAGGVRTRSRLSEDFIETVAFNSAFLAEVTGEPCDGRDLHARAAALAGGPGEVARDVWRVSHREDGCPSLIRGTETRPVSFSHHGRFAGFALVLP